MAKKKYVSSSAAMWSLFLEYKNEVKSNPINIIEQRKGAVVLPKNFEGELPAAIITLPVQRPLTMEGFENFCADKNIINDLGDYFSNKNDQYAAFSTICSRIKRVIREDQITGGMVGIFNASITQRLNGLADKQDVGLEASGDVKITLNLNPGTNV